MVYAVKNKSTGKFRVKRWFSSRTRRGYGIHSPFAYSLIRQGFGPESFEVTNIAALSGLGLQRKTAERIERLYMVCGCESMATDCLSAEEAMAATAAPRTLFLVSATELDAAGLDAAVMERIISIKEAASGSGGILCLVNPRKGRLWRGLCRRIAEMHDGMGIESRDLMIIFTDKGLNKQHIRV